MYNRRHQRSIINRDGMIEEQKGVAPDVDSDLEDHASASSQVIKVRNRKGSSAAAEQDFEEKDCESDYEDQLDSLRQAKRRKREENAERENRRMIKSTYLPASCKKLSACVTCRLVLNREKWRKLGQCPNCPQSMGLSDTTENFSNLIGSVIPGQSWVASWCNLKELIPGFYAMNICVDSIEAE